MVVVHAALDGAPSPQTAEVPRTYEQLRTICIHGWLWQAGELEAVTATLDLERSRKGKAILMCAQAPAAAAIGAPAALKLQAAQATTTGVATGVSESVGLVVIPAAAAAEGGTGAEEVTAAVPVEAHRTQFPTPRA